MNDVKTFEKSKFLFNLLLKAIKKYHYIYGVLKDNKYNNSQKTKGLSIRYGSLANKCSILLHLV